ncbi:TRAP transporter large permease [Dethiosulfatarculus sandiegensis]|uniref:C4-dicarboxylate ABC transporter permease n=1 Tax=Dethiosulfatarculus sandiegensis TaxID=1429043 RepID=A0A0D2K1U5_9BACT|nr:TRAP transporter large permease [Dethiosulfatarculus sandiegensis]KIX15655.1 C4-dicarboxylate ABC transporter permease [Dethiosulfatarculus sandiegensis]
MTAILFISLIVCFGLGMPIAFSLGVSSVATLGFGSSLPLTLAAQRLFAGTDSFPLMAIPFFMLAGALMENGGISRRLVDFAHSLVGGIYGGLGMVAVLAAMFFAGISGAAAADTAAVGAVSIPAMIRKGYKKGFAAAIQAAGGSIGVIIPPSIPMIIYGVVGGVSIGKMFLGGFVPGALIGGGLMVASYFLCKKAGYKKDHASSLKEVWRYFADALWALLMPGIILGGILGGVFTPTEAAVVAAVYGLVVGLFIYKELSFKDLPKIFAKAAVSTSTVMLLIGTASIFGWILTAEQVPQSVAAYLTTLTDSPMVLYALVLVMLLVVGTFMETSASLIILTPVFLPVVKQFGIDPVHFGVVMVTALAIGMLTPPLGICLFISCNIARIQLTQIVGFVWPLLGIMIVILLLITFIPGLVMFVPNMF